MVDFQLADPPDCIFHKTCVGKVEYVFMTRPTHLSYFLETGGGHISAMARQAHPSWSSTSIKLVNVQNGNIHRVRLTTQQAGDDPLEALLNMCREVLKLTVPSLDLTYVDDEDETIIISSSDELLEAFDALGKGKTLKIFVTASSVQEATIETTVPTTAAVTAIEKATIETTVPTTAAVTAIEKATIETTVPTTAAVTAIEMASTETKTPDTAAVSAFQTTTKMTVPPEKPAVETPVHSQNIAVKRQIEFEAELMASVLRDDASRIWSDLNSIDPSTQQLLGYIQQEYLDSGPDISVDLVDAFNGCRPHVAVDAPWKWEDFKKVMCLCGPVELLLERVLSVFQSSVRDRISATLWHLAPAPDKRDETTEFLRVHGGCFIEPHFKKGPNAWQVVWFDTKGKNTGLCRSIVYNLGPRGYVSAPIGGETGDTRSYSNLPDFLSADQRFTRFNPSESRQPPTVVAVWYRTPEDHKRDCKAVITAIHALLSRIKEFPSADNVTKVMLREVSKHAAELFHQSKILGSEELDIRWTVIDEVRKLFQRCSTNLALHHTFLIKELDSVIWNKHKHNVQRFKYAATFKMEPEPETLGPESKLIVDPAVSLFVVLDLKMLYYGNVHASVAEQYHRVHDIQVRIYRLRQAGENDSADKLLKAESDSMRRFMKYLSTL
jgi:PB1 domain